MDTTTPNERFPVQVTAFGLLVARDPEEAAAQLAPLIDSGATSPDIAARYGVNESTLRRWIYRLLKSKHLKRGLKLGPRARTASAEAIDKASPADAKLARSASRLGSQAAAARKAGVTRARVSSAVRRASEKK